MTHIDFPATEFIALDDAELEYWPNHDSGIIIFYPGTMLAPGHYRLIIQELFRAGFTVAAIHFPGHGRGRKKSGLTFNNMLEIGLRTEAWLAENKNPWIAVMGHSQGGILAMWHAACSASLSCSFSITSVFPQMREAIRLTNFSHLEDKRRQIMCFISSLAKLLPWLPVPLPFYLSLRKIVSGKRPPLYMGKDKGRISYPLKFLASLFEAEIPSTLLCPWWLFSSRNDALFTEPIILKTFEFVEAPEKNLVWLEDGGHMAVMNPAISRFIARYAAAQCAGLNFPLHLESSPEKSLF